MLREVRFSYPRGEFKLQLLKMSTSEIGLGKERWFLPHGNGVHVKQRTKGAVLADNSE